MIVLRTWHPIQFLKSEIFFIVIAKVSWLISWKIQWKTEIICNNTSSTSNKCLYSIMESPPKHKHTFLLILCILVHKIIFYKAMRGFTEKNPWRYLPHSHYRKRWQVKLESNQGVTSQGIVWVIIRRIRQEPLTLLIHRSRQDEMTDECTGHPLCSGRSLKALEEKDAWGHQGMWNPTEELSLTQ